jgi:hypothetical protein
MDEQKLKEGTVSGTVEMLKPLITRFSQDNGFFAYAPQTDISGPNFEQFLIVAKLSDGECRVGIVDLQQLPNQRVLIAFRLYPWPEAPEQQIAERRQGFDTFTDSFLRRLIQLGFVELPESPKGPIGFVPKAPQS